MFSIKNCNNKVGIITLTLFFIAFGYSVASSAGIDNKDEIKQQFDQTFYTMLDDPSNIDITMKYAKLAVQMEDYEAAIPALERILLFNPDLPSVKHELGVMYYRLESFDMAKSYLIDAKNSNGVTPEVVEKANKYLSLMN